MASSTFSPDPCHVTTAGVACLVIGTSCRWYVFVSFEMCVRVCDFFFLRAFLHRHSHIPIYIYTYIFIQGKAYGDALDNEESAESFLWRVHNGSLGPSTETTTMQLISHTGGDGMEDNRGKGDDDDDPNMEEVQQRELPQQQGTLPGPAVYIKQVKRGDFYKPTHPPHRHSHTHFMLSPLYPLFPYLTLLRNLATLPRPPPRAF